MDRTHRIAGTLGRYSRGAILNFVYLATFAIVFATVHTIGRAFSDFFALDAKKFLGSILLYVIPFITALLCADSLKMRMGRREWNAPGWSFVKKVAAVLFAAGALLTLLQYIPAQTPTPADETSVPSPTAVMTESESSSELIAATPLSEDLPADLPKPEGDPSFSEEYEFMIPSDVAANRPVGHFMGIGEVSGMQLPRDQWKPYYQGLVRAGLEDIGLCVAGDACPATVRFRFSSWEEKSETITDWGLKRQTDPGLTLIQATFTTRSTWNEIVYSDRDHTTRGWRKTSDGWLSVGVLTHISVARPVGIPPDTTPESNEKVRDTFRRLLACTYNTDSHCK